MITTRYNSDNGTLDILHTEDGDEILLDTALIGRGLAGHALRAATTEAVAEFQE